MGVSEAQVARLDEKVGVLAKAHSELREKVDELEDIVISHTMLLDQHQISHDKINEIHETFTQVKAGFVVLGWLGKAAKFLWPVMALLAAVAIYIKTGVWSYKT